MSSTPYTFLPLALAIFTCALPGAFADTVTDDTNSIEEIVVWGERATTRAGERAPGTLLTPADLLSINVATTEDIVKYEPGVVIRRRFIGDSNGTMGMRGSNMFQTSRSMVFADGVPLHYLLQSRWNGAPRWTMVSASEIAQVELLYGPFSAEYSGNSMGGVMLIESAIPQQREFHVDASVFAQDFSAYGYDDTITGYKTFASYGDRIGDTSVYLSYNRLENDSQPQTFYFGGGASPVGATPVSGLIAGNDERGNARLWFGDTGEVNTVTDNYKVKIGHDFGDWATLLNVAYEDRLTDASSPNTYLRAADGTPVFSGTVVQDGVAVSVPASRLGVSVQERDSLSLGLRVRGPIREGIDLEATLNRFEILRDTTRASLSNPEDPAFVPAGEVTTFGDTGWQGAQVKVVFGTPRAPGLEVAVGASVDSYELNLDVADSPDYLAGTIGSYTSRSGGRTRTRAMFVQLDWDISERWDLGLGLRAEDFRSEDGYFSRDDTATPGLDLIAVPGTSDSKLSPKFSVGFSPQEQWHVAYAVGQAYRFPIVEELFSQFSAYNAISVANPALKPEDGVHHNLMFERRLPRGLLRLNLFSESIDDVIEAQSETLPGGLSVRTFIPIDRVDTSGVEFIANTGLADGRVDARFNVVYTDSEIVSNVPDPSIEGHVYPRMPEWRANLLATWHVTSALDAAVNVQYASDSYGRNDNSDRQEGVYGAQDGYTRIGLKSTYRFGKGLAFGFGVDNITNEIAYVAHPWPGRTFYASMTYDL